MSITTSTTEYSQVRRVRQFPRIPLEGGIDLTYRCNNHCRHCWLWIPPDSAEAGAELSFEEIKRIVDEARSLGCRKWRISGGEPMLRPDFAEIFDYITSHSSSYSINTNGTLITSEIARLMKRKGVKMVAIYGATADVHDHITRMPGSFEATMRGFRHLKEALAGFIVQVIPMRDNYHQFSDMVKLAESLSGHYRIGAAWLFLSASGDPEMNKEISRQRLPPEEVVKLDLPDIPYEDRVIGDTADNNCRLCKSDHLLAPCIKDRRSFHIDPYGRMTFCCFVKDSRLQYDLKKGSLMEAWEDLIPSLEEKIPVTTEYSENCGSCELRSSCRWCPVYGYLEHGRFTARIDYLCEAARAKKRFKDDWRKNHRRYYRTGGINIQVDSDLPFKDDTFRPKFKLFEAGGPGEDAISIRHRFSFPDLDGKYLGEEIYRKPPWAIYRNKDSWIYVGIMPNRNDRRLHRVAVFNHDHTQGQIYSKSKEDFHKGNWQSLTFFPTDQILIGRVLAERGGFYLHSCGVNLDGKGLLFTGHSEAGKSTIARLLKGKAEILCDDRIIVRRVKPHVGSREPEFRIYGTWSHGDVPDVSANSAPLCAILFLNKSAENRIVPLYDKKEITKRLLACLVKPLVTVDWWEKTLSLVERLSDEVPCYDFYFDKSGGAVDTIESFFGNPAADKPRKEDGSWQRS